MKRIIGFVFIFMGVLLIGFGSCKKLEKENNSNEGTDGKIDVNSGEISYHKKYEDVISYLTEKYNEEFELEKLETTYCLETTDSVSFYSMPCSSDKIKHDIYKVKAKENGIFFYVKEVSYDEKKVNILTSEKDFETKGYYDNYMSYVMKEKLEDAILSSYKKKFGKNITISIYEGMGIYDITLNNAYQYLDGKLQVITDKEVSLDDFIDNITEQNFSVLIKTDKKITADNFWEEVSLFEDISTLKYSGLALKNIIVTYENGDRYLSYDSSLKSLELLSGKDTTSPSNKKVYAKTINFGSTTSTDGINYQELKKLSATSFNF